MDQQAEKFLSTVDQSTFSTAPYQKVVKKPWGRELHLTPEDAPYTAKIIEIYKGCRLSLQAHDEKAETWTVLSGEAGVILENSHGQLEEIKLEPGKGYTTALGQRHRLFGITDCAVFEASTPELGNTFRLEDDYARPTETEEMRKDPNRGWQG